MDGACPIGRARAASGATVAPRDPDAPAAVWNGGMLAPLDRGLTLLMRLSLLLYLPFAFAALFTFDAPGSDRNPYAYLFAFGILAYGPAVVAAQVLRSILRRSGQAALGAYLGFAPLLLLGMAGAGLAGIVLVCGGSFDCR